MRAQGWAHCWYVDDILALGESKQEAEERSTALVEKMTELEIRVNPEKSMSVANQMFQYVGHNFNLVTNEIWPLEEKTGATLKMAARQLSGNKVQAKNLAALAGNMLDSVKSNVNLTGLPQQVMRHAGKIVNENTKLGMHIKAAWGKARGRQSSWWTR